MKHLKSYEEVVEIKETLVRDASLKQLQKIAKMTKNTDIGLREPDTSKFGNVSSIKNILLDTKVETYEDYMKKSRKEYKHLKQFPPKP